MRHGACTLDTGHNWSRLETWQLQPFQPDMDEYDGDKDARMRLNI